MYKFKNKDKLINELYTILCEARTDANFGEVDEVPLWVIKKCIKIIDENIDRGNNEKSND